MQASDVKALAMLGGTYGRRVVVVAGKGNNGADGRAAAERLRRRGVRVTVIAAGFDGGTPRRAVPAPGRRTEPAASPTAPAPAGRSDATGTTFERRSSAIGTALRFAISGCASVSFSMAASSSVSAMS